MHGGDEGEGRGEKDEDAMGIGDEVAVIDILIETRLAGGECSPDVGLVRRIDRARLALLRLEMR